MRASCYILRYIALVHRLIGCSHAFTAGQQLTTFNHQSKIFVGGKIDSSGKLIRTFRGSLAGPVWFLRSRAFLRESYWRGKLGESNISYKNSSKEDVIMNTSTVA